MDDHKIKEAVIATKSKLTSRIAGIIEDIDDNQINIDDLHDAELNKVEKETAVYYYEEGYKEALAELSIELGRRNTND